MAGPYGRKLTTGGQVSDYIESLINPERMREERTAKAKASLKKHGIAAALLFRPENIRYATSVKTTEFIDRLVYTLFFAEGDYLCYDDFEGFLWPYPWIKRENVKLSLQYANSAPGISAVKANVKEFAKDIKAALKARGMDKEPIGIDEIDEVGRQALVDEGIHLVDVMPAMLEARAIKTQDEINCMHMVTVLCDAAHSDMYRALKPGVRERDIRAIGVESLLRNGAEDVWDVLVSGGGTAQGLSWGWDRIIQPGDCVTIDIVRATYLGYTSCYYRNYMIGVDPTPQQMDLHKRSYERMYSVIESIKPGVTTGEVAQKWATKEEKGLQTDRRLWCDDLAHGLGLWLYEYPMCNRLWSIEHPQVFEKGMTMAVEAMEFHPLVGRTKLEEMLVITDDGVEVFSRMPVKDIMVAGRIDAVPVVKD